MTENQTAQQGFDAWDVSALGSIILGIVAILLAVFLPQRDIGIGIIAVVATLALAILSGTRTRGRATAWIARVGSAAGVVALLVIIAGAIIL